MTALALTKNLVCAIGAVAASLTFMTAAAGPAHAASAVARVSVADLDLSKDAGQQTLARRIKAAAETVCDENGRTPREQRERRRCVAATIDDAFLLASTRV
ncbi:MAG: UrcA family protein [Sphingomonadaceae bacterium]|nr:UrcA family protein [Sphingomonadaceae bacterium]